MRANPNHNFPISSAPLAPVIDTQRTLAYDQLYLCWRLPSESSPAWHFSVEYRRRGVVPGGGTRAGLRGGLAEARWGWQRLDEVSGTSAVINRLEMDSVYVLRVRGCNKAGFGEYSEEVYLHTPPAPGKCTACFHLDKTHLWSYDGYTAGVFQPIWLSQYRYKYIQYLVIWQMTIHWQIHAFKLNLTSFNISELSHFMHNYLWTELLIIIKPFCMFEVPFLLLLF